MTHELEWTMPDGTEIIAEYYGHEDGVDRDCVYIVTPNGELVNVDELLDALGAGHAMDDLFQAAYACRSSRTSATATIPPLSRCSARLPMLARIW